MEESIIINEIEKLRRRMEMCAEVFGLNHHKVVEISQRIDILHTKLLKLQGIKIDEVEVNKIDEVEVNYVQKKKNGYVKEISFAWN